MILRVIREPTIDDATLSVWFVNGHFECFGIEDAIRERPGEPVGAWKVPGKTAIPAGAYRLIITDSARFKRPMPLLLDVPGFTGIRIHPGNAKEDTAGCLMPGRVRAANRVGESRLAFDRLFGKIEAAIAAGERVVVNIEPPDARQ